MKVLITGAQFDNKGAQSLLFSVINEIYNKYGMDEIKIYYVPVDDISKYDCSRYNFNFVFDNCYGTDCLDLARKLHRTYKCMKRSFAIRNKLKSGEIVKLSSCWDDMDLHVDVSGYTLSSKWQPEINNRILRYINGSHKRKIPVILMPQSFGPFDFSGKVAFFDSIIPEAMSKVDVICAREKDGVAALKDKYGITDNVKLYPDLVLASSSITPGNIFTGEYESKNKEISTNNNVGIIPNEQLLVGNSEQFVLNYYSVIIDELLKKGKNVYIFRHSNDVSICKKIYEYVHKDNIHLILDDFDCLSFSNFVKQFDFVIASRFHSIVHSYKCGIPAIILGWSIKYLELAQRFGQERYVIDVNMQNAFDENETRSMIDNMCNCFSDEARTIQDKLLAVRSDSCYNELWKLMDGKV